MLGYCITFRSVTFAQRGERMLHNGGVACTLQRTPKWMEERGCGYCLRIGGSQLAEGVRLLRTGKIPFRKVYSFDGTDTPEEVSL